MYVYRNFEVLTKQYLKKNKFNLCTQKMHTYRQKLYIYIFTKTYQLVHLVRVLKRIVKCCYCGIACHQFYARAALPHSFVADTHSNIYMFINNKAPK